MRYLLGFVLGLALVTSLGISRAQASEASSADEGLVAAGQQEAGVSQTRGSEPEVASESTGSWLERATSLAISSNAIAGRSITGHDFNATRHVEHH